MTGFAANFLGGKTKVLSQKETKGTKKTPCQACFYRVRTRLSSWSPLSSVQSLWYTCLALLGLGLAIPGLFSAAALAEEWSNATTVILVLGAPGEPDYETNFLAQAAQWEKGCAQAGCCCLTLGRGVEPGQTNDLDRLQQTLAAQPKDGPGQLWLVLIGHGTFDGKEARFNLRGPDLAATELAGWLRPFHRPLAIVDTSSSSAPFLNLLSATNRVVITATRSGYEQNFTRFGEYFAPALTDPAADLDKDGQVSLLEAFLAASRRAAEFYKTQGRLVTEHALLDDNGDGLGTPADWFHGVRATKKPQDKAGVDGLLALQFCLVPGAAERRLSPGQRAQRDALERAVFLYREKKAELPEDEYYQGLERVLLDLARFNATNAVAPVTN